MKQECYLLDPMVYFFEKLRKEWSLRKLLIPQSQGGGVVNIAYLLILRTWGMEKTCEQWEDIQFGLNTWQAFKDHFLQSYRHYQIRKKETDAAHGYGNS